jgi:hypothetical protein
VTDSLDRATLQAIVSSIESALKLVSMGERDEAVKAVERGEAKLEKLAAERPKHARIVRKAREAVELARLALKAPKRGLPAEDGDPAIRNRRERVSAARRACTRLLAA